MTVFVRLLYYARPTKDEQQNKVRSRAFEDISIKWPKIGVNGEDRKFKIHPSCTQIFVCFWSWPHSKSCLEYLQDNFLKFVNFFWPYLQQCHHHFLSKGEEYESSYDMHFPHYYYWLQCRPLLMIIYLLLFNVLIPRSMVLALEAGMCLSYLRIRGTCFG